MGKERRQQNHQPFLSCSLHWHRSPVGKAILTCLSMREGIWMYQDGCTHPASTQEIRCSSSRTSRLQALQGAHFQQDQQAFDMFGIVWQWLIVSDSVFWSPCKKSHMNVLAPARRLDEPVNSAMVNSWQNMIIGWSFVPGLALVMGKNVLRRTASIFLIQIKDKLKDISITPVTSLQRTTKATSSFEG